MELRHTKFCLVTLPLFSLLHTSTDPGEKNEKEKKEGGLNIAKRVSQVGMTLTGRSISCKVTFPGMSTCDPFWLILILAHSFMHEAVLLAAAEIKQAHLA